MNIKKAFYGNTVYQVFSVLNKRDQRFTFVVLAIQVFFGLMDLVGVALVGVLGALAVNGIQSGVPGSRVTTALEILNLQDLSFQRQVTWLGILASVFLVTRTLLSALLTKRTLKFLSNRGAKISSDLVNKFLAQPLASVQNKSSFENMYSLTTGVWIAILEVLGTAIVMAADLSLLLVLTIGLLVLDPSLAVMTTLTFTLVGLSMYRLMQGKAKKLGEEKSKLEIASNQKISEVIGSYRESVVRGRRFYYAQEIGKLRFAMAKVEAESSFMPYVSKYVIETTVIIGALVISSFQFLVNDAVHAIATLTVFMAAGSRIAPAVLRLQQGGITVRGRVGQSQSTIELIDLLKNSEFLNPAPTKMDFKHNGFSGSIRMLNVQFTYPNRDEPAIKVEKLEVKAGQSLAIVGPSGAGKTTLVDVLLGIFPPESGIVEIGGMKPLDVIAKWPGSVSYVPQDITITPGTLRQNISLGFDIESKNDELILNAIRLAQLEEFVADMPHGIDTHLGERGGNISGGQRQRIGIARALFTNPKLLVFDEATSALDGETEAAISEAILNLKGSTTVVVIAHRLASVRNCDSILYVEAGESVLQGTFEEIRKGVPNFEKQAHLMGL